MTYPFFPYKIQPESPQELLRYGGYRLPSFHSWRSLSRDRAVLCECWPLVCFRLFGRMKEGGSWGGGGIVIGCCWPPSSTLPRLSPYKVVGQHHRLVPSTGVFQKTQRTSDLRESRYHLFPSKMCVETRGRKSGYQK